MRLFLCEALPAVRSFFLYLDHVWVRSLRVLATFCSLVRLWGHFFGPFWLDCAVGIWFRIKVEECVMSQFSTVSRKNIKVSDGVTVIPVFWSDSTQTSGNFFLWMCVYVRDVQQGNWLTDHCYDFWEMSSDGVHNEFLFFFCHYFAGCFSGEPAPMLVSVHRAAVFRNISAERWM